MAQFKKDTKKSTNFKERCEVESREPDVPMQMPPLRETDVSNKKDQSAGKQNKHNCENVLFRTNKNKKQTVTEISGANDK